MPGLRPQSRIFQKIGIKKKMAGAYQKSGPFLRGGVPDGAHSARGRTKVPKKALIGKLPIRGILW